MRLEGGSIIPKNDVRVLLIAREDIPNVPRSAANRSRSGKNGGECDGCEGRENGRDTHANCVSSVIDEEDGRVRRGW